MKKILVGLVIPFLNSCTPVYAQQGIYTDYVRLQPTTLPSVCNQGDMRFNSGTSLLSVCNSANAWTSANTLSTSPAYTQLGNNTASATVPVGNQQMILGVPKVVDTGIATQFTSGTNSYYQSIWQNTSASGAASTDLVLNNNLGTATSYYLDVGINSSGFSGNGSLNLPNAGYVYSESGDLVLATNTPNTLRLLTSGSTTDSIDITSSGQIIWPAFTGFLYGNGPGAITASAGISGTSVVGNISGNAANITSTSNTTLTSLTGLTSAPSLSTVGVIGTGQWHGTVVPITYGGTSGATAASGFTNLSPMTTPGDIIYENASSAAIRLGIGTSGYVLTAIGSAPTWQAVTPTFSGLSQYGGIYASTTSNLASTAQGTSGYVLTAQGANPPIFSPVTPTFSGLTNHGMIYASGTTSLVSTAAGTSGQILISNGTTSPPIFANLLQPGSYILTSGNGTFTVPFNPPPLYLKVRMCGGGGGGSGSGTGGGGSPGTNGTASLFGNLTASGGTFVTPATSGAIGGAFNVGTGWLNIASQQGNGGQPPNTTGTSNAPGSTGGVCPLGHLSAQGGSTSNGSNADSNTGSGGQGGGGDGGANSDGSGGGAGAYVEAYTSGTVSSTYSYTIGTYGTGGAGGGGGLNGGNGSSGVIIIEPHYQ